MAQFKELRNALASLHEAINNFPVGAVSVDDFRSVEEKISSTRESLKNLNAKLLRLETKRDMLNDEETPKENIEDLVDMVHTTTATSIVHDKVVKLCLHSATIQSILNKQEGNPEMQKKVSLLMKSLFSYNHEVICTQKKIMSAMDKQLDLKIQCHNALYDHQDFLKEQKELRRMRLEKIETQTVRNKEKMEGIIRKINIMKRLITNFIAASSLVVQKKTFLVEMLEKHRELLNVETISRLSNSTENKA